MEARAEEADKTSPNGDRVTKGFQREGTQSRVRKSHVRTGRISGRGNSVPTGRQLGTPTSSWHLGVAIPMEAIRQVPCNKITPHRG